MRVLDLFSGIGGFSLGLERAGMTTVAMCEIDPWARKVLRKHWPHVPIHEDITKLRGCDVGPVDLICGGFPCQDVSCAGKGEGFGTVESPTRSGLWWEMHRLIDEIRPAWVIAENVPALRSRGADRVLADMEGSGYTCWPLVVGADDVGAPHRRKRVWIVAHADSIRRPAETQRGEHSQPGGEWQNDFTGRASKDAESVAHTGSTQSRRVSSGERETVPTARSHGEAVADAELLTVRPGLCQSQQGGQRRGRPGDRGGEVADPTGVGRNPFRSRESGSHGEEPTDAKCSGLEGPGGEHRLRSAEEEREACRGSWWAVEPDVGRVAHGVPRRVDRLRGLGNAVAPLIPELIGRAIMQADGDGMTLEVTR